MKSIIKDNVHVIILDRGEEIMKTLTEYVIEHNLKAGVIKGIGALKDITIGYYNLEKKDYMRRSISPSCELLNFLGNISQVEHKHFIHAHVILTKPDFTLEGGHLFYGIVSVTAEIYIYPLEHEINRFFNDELKLNLIDL
ncbi:MAG: DNA-binding protein [Planctomycetes bacterium]|nr:DNA-binding protein [Planctomycetota bacterium]